jgi:hypothetical protein
VIWDVVQASLGPLCFVKKGDTEVAEQWSGWGRGSHKEFVLREEENLSLLDYG